ncbi:zinc finger protein 469 [Rhinoderma darwinii]|uniref:zinc finger protein 469 n=1 Tax=Rhinoderma darwinii TaxID=43563 RepID=UPI003F666F09
MTRETKPAYPIKAKSPSSKDDSAFEQFGKTNSADSKPSGASINSNSVFIPDKASLLNGRERESHSQREAVIRPQQAGKIDFKALHNRPKFSSDATWTNGKSSPLSPTGKNRGKDKNKRSGKGDRSQHQLYRLSISSSRSNPTIGIAYPQQKVTPPKNIEVSQAPISGSYRFNVSSLPDREGEVHQEDRTFNRSHPEPSPSLTSTSYTSQTAPAPRIHQGLKIQPGNLHDTANSSGQLHYLEFQQNENTWHPSDKHFAGTSGYVISNQKVCPFPEGNKSDFGPVSFQYPFHSLQEQVGSTFCNNGSNQDYVDAALAANQVAHNTYSFQSSSREGPQDSQGHGTYNTVLPDNRTFAIPSQQATFLHTQQGVQHSPTPPSYTGCNEHVSDHNGAISSTGAFSSSGAIEQTQSTFQKNQSVFNPSEFSLHGNSMPALMNKRQQPSKDFVHSQRLLTPASTLRRNIPQTALNKVHFPGKVYNSVNTGSVPFEKNLSRIPQTWDDGNNNFPPLDQNSASYPNASGNVITYQCQPNEQRPVLKNQRVPWQQSINTPSTTNQNRIDLTRHIGSQKPPYTLSNPDWQNNNLMTKIPPSYHTKKHLVVEGSPTQKADMTRQNYSSNNEILYDNTKDPNDTRNKSISYGVSQPIQQSLNNSNQTLPLSGKTFVTESPYESPLPSPVTNAVSGSTCSSLSPMSSSPVNPDENQVPHITVSSPYFHQPCHTAEKPFSMSDSISSGSFLYSSSKLPKTYNYISELSKDEHAFKSLQENQYQKIANEQNKGCLENFESEPPPPYSSHHFLASSLSSANLDQLDVLLTCKQCDQNFGNLSSFLEHRQYCNMNSTVQTEMKDSLHGGDIRKSSVDPLKSSQILPGISLSKAQLEFNSHLTGFRKEYLLDSDVKADAKDDLMKGNILHTATPHLMPLTACDNLEIDDAKLDSLIIEALNGLEFQVDNPEIDSTFIDVFVDDDLTTAKVCSNSQKVKENKETRLNRINVEQKQAHHNSNLYTFEEKYDTEASQVQKNAIKMRNEQICTGVGSAHKHSIDTESTNSKIITKTNLEDCEWHKSDDINKSATSQEKKKTTLKTDFEHIDGTDIKSYESQQGRTIKNDRQDFALTETTKSRRAGFKDIKKKKAHNGTWSKELIHKIVQQKNKLHKLHVKSNKNVQLSLVTERLFTPTNTHPFGEYDYISDSDDELTTSLPGKMANSRIKYNFNRDIQGRGTKTKVKEPIWRMGEATRFQLQSKDLRNTNKETANRIRRRNSQSSNSSDQSTSISSETGSSPKSTERTDSENEQECVLRCKTFSTQSQNNADRNLVKRLLRENSPETEAHTDFAKGTKRFGSAKFLLANSKFYQKNNFEIHYNEKEKLQQTTDSTKKNTSKTHGIQGLKNTEEDRLSTYQEPTAASTLSEDNYTSKLMVNIDTLPQQHSSYHVTSTNYQEKQLNSMSGAPDITHTEINPAFCDSVKYFNEDICNGSKDFSISVPCYNGDSTVPLMLQQKSYGDECQPFPHNKDVNHLYRNNIFPKSQTDASTDIEQIYANQNTNNLHSFEDKCSELASYPSDNNENKVSAGLSFDSNSLFAELPISDFETPLFNDAATSKDNYIEFNQSSKSSNFEEQFPEFLQEKSWDLIRDVSMSTNNVPEFHIQENQAPDKYPEHIPVSSEQITTLSDYNVAFINNISEDELEIKRLITELESQLQKSKVHNDTPSKISPKHQINQELTDSALTLPEMAVNPIESCRNNAYYNEIPNNVHNPTHQLQDTQPLVKVDRSCENLRNSWTSSVQFDSFTSDIQCRNQTSMLNNACMTKELSPLGNNHSPSADMSDACLSNLTNQIECPSYPEHDLLKETFVPDKTQSSKNSENNGINEKESMQKDTQSLSAKEQKCKEKYDDPPKLEPVQSVTVMDSEFALQDDSTPVFNMTDSEVRKSGASEERLCDPQLLSASPETAADIGYNNRHFILHDREELKDDNNHKNFVLLDMPILVKEENAINEKSLISKESSENPLQQLQLFVARTAKNNEEDMILPCFPTLLAASAVPESKTETETNALCTVESTVTSIGESEENPKIVEHNGILQLSESCTQRIEVDHAGSNCCTFLESLSNEAQCEDKQTNSKECPERSALNVSTVGLRNDPGYLLSEKPSQVEEENNGKVRSYGEIDYKKSSSFMKKEKPTSTNTVFDNEVYTGNKINTSTRLDVQKHSSDISEVDCLETGALDPKRSQISKKTGIEKQDPSTEFSVLRTIENNQQHTDILKETELFLGIDNTKETSLLSEDKCDATATADKSSTYFPLPSNTNEVLCNSNNDYETHLLSIPTAHSVLSFDLLSHVSLKESMSPQKLLYTSADDGLSSEERDLLCKNTEKCQNEKELANHSVEDMDIQLYLHKDKTLTLDNSQKLVEEKVSKKPVFKGNTTPCFCSELVCGHYKDQQQESVTDIIIGCQSIPTNDIYPNYTGENTNYLTQQNNIVPEIIQTPVGPSMCNEQEETNKCDWNNSHDGSNMELVFRNKEDRTSAIVCDLMDISNQEFVEFDCHKKPTEKTVVQLVTGLHNIDVENKVSADESDNRCTNDMHSVIDGVLRILEGDKSKEILQSIGISPKSSPIKEKKSVGLSLTCDICSVSFRSKPGLTRHKAVKHNGSLATQKVGVSSVKPLNVKNAASEWNSSNDSQDNLDTTSQNIIADFLNGGSKLQSQILVPDIEQRPLTAKNKGEKRTNGQFEDTAICDSASKNKLNRKVKKRKCKPSNKSTDSQIPPDDVLNILKTNILKAIGQSNSFNSTETSLEQYLNKDKAHTEISSKNESIETYTTAITIDDDEKLVSDVLEMEMNGESLHQEQTWAKNLNSHNENIINDCKMKPLETMSANDQGLLIGGEECSVGTAQVQKDVEVSNLPKETVTDFNIFFDDDNTFSQLFPRDDHFIRRKCTRVYGKRNKKQTPPFEADFKHIDIAEQCHTTQINYSSDYGDISLESTLDSRNFSNQNEHLAHYEHLSSSKKISMGDESKILSFVCQNQENMNVPLLIDRIENTKDRDVTPHITLYKPSSESSDLSVEMSPDTRDSQTEDILNCNAANETGLPEVPTIDMEMLSTKFDMRELSFFSACGDDSDKSDLDASDINQMPEKRKKNGKNKLNDKKHARNHNNTKIKSKDKQYKCKVCFQWFLTLGELDFHKLTHNPSPPPTCYMCVQRKFSSREQLRDHLKEKHAKNKAGLWICGMCLKEISDVWMYNEHLREHATQFARKGQAQKSVMGIPGCFGGDSMVRTFLSTFIYRTPSKLSKISETDDKGVSNKRQDQKENKSKEETIKEKEPENVDHVVPPAPIQQVKLSVSPSMDSSQKSDIISKNAAMHPHCKDPSRDCHHCGKQFPKPFKLQRHLVVHSLQKIYLCHKCPKSYQEAQELRNHLNNEHQLAEKSEIKHTTLYACELCADVMHVIKKSFICSTCNYTFSKKEQYDRHMEKHLIGGSMTFKFRGVTRPTISGKELKLKIKDSPEYDNTPPPKKRKTSIYSHTYEDIEAIDHSDLSQCPKLSPNLIFDEMKEENLGSENESTVKIEEILMDAPELQAEGKVVQNKYITEECPLFPKDCDAKISENQGDCIIGDTVATIEFSACTEKSVAFPVGDAEYTDITDMPTDDRPKCKLVEPTYKQTSQVKADENLAQLLAEEPVKFPTSCKTTPLANENPTEHKGLEDDKEETLGSLLLDEKKTLVSVSTNEKSLMTALDTSVKSLQKYKSGSQLTETNVTESNSVELLKIFTPKLKPEFSLSRDTGSCNLKETNASQMKMAKKDLTVNMSKNNTDFKMLDKMSGAICQKLHQKKRKEHKISVHKGNASQENLVEVKKKKTKLVVTGKSESSINIKKSEWITGLLDIKDETPGIRPHPKPHTGGIGGQFKKAVLDTHNQKKLSSQSINGEYRSKKTIVTKSNHHPKSSALSSNSSSHKRKMGHNKKTTEPSNYRTAESQNNLLSQLFGQKLTSFKIPLRRDVTE